IATGTSELRRVYRRPLLALLGVVGLVLLVACANITNLQLARATARRQELSVRRALGATGWRLARQLLVESVIMAGAGAVPGLLFAPWPSRLLVAQMSTRGTPVALELAVDWRVLGFTTAVAVVVAVVFGVAPAFQAAQLAPVEAIRSERPGLTG